jgi:tRNA (adenine22-N1)-methyltransferase
MSSLGLRLEAAIALADKQDQSIDVGTDHGYLAIELIRRGLSQTVIASDNKPLPLERAKTNIARAGLEDTIVCRLGEGLSWLDCSTGGVFILGMGGLMISSILETRGTGPIKTLILGPNTEAKELRQSLERLGFAIIDESFVEDRGKYYPLIKCVNGTMKLSLAEAAFGPINLRKRPQALLDFLAQKHAILKAGLERTKDAFKRTTLCQEIAFLEEIINERY